MAELIDMEKVAGRYQSKHDLMQDIPQSKTEKVDVRDHFENDGGYDGPLPGAPRMSSKSNAKSKPQSHTYNNNETNITQEAAASDVDVQTKAITSQSKTLDAQTGLMKDQSHKLDTLNVTMEKLYSLLYREHTKPEPKYQGEPISNYKAKERPVDANGQSNSFADLASDVMDMIGGGKDKKSKRGRKKPKVQGGGRFGKLWNGAKNIGGSIFGLGGGGAGGPGLGSRIMGGAKSMFSGGGGGGWRGKLAKGALGAGAAAVGYKGLESLGGLGAVSAMFESGKGGVGTISTGAGDHGGQSYGAHQLSSKSGTMAKFLRSEQGAKYADQFAGLTPGTPAFNAAYKNVVGNDSKGFEEAQSGFMKATHYDPAARKLADDTGLDVSKRSRAVQEMVYSTSTQYGGNSSVMAKALQGKDANSMSDADIISAVQDYKRDNVGTNFKSSSAKVQASVAQRAENEKKTLQKILEDEKKNPQGVMKGEEKKVDGNTASDIAQGKTQAADVPTVGIMPMQPQDIKADSELNEEPELETPEVTQAGMTTTQQVGAGLAVGGVAKAGVDTAKGVSAAKKVVTGAESIGVKGVAKGAGKLLGPVASIGIDGYRAAEVINDDTIDKQNKERELAGIGGSMAGAVAGGTLGAIGGSFVPVVGNVVGGIGGAIAGSIVGEEGVKAGMDYVMGTPEERQKKAAQGMMINSPLVQGEHSTLPGAPVTLPSVKDLMTVPSKQPTELKQVAKAAKPIEGTTPIVAAGQKVTGTVAAAGLNPKNDDDISPEELVEWQKWMGDTSTTGARLPVPTPKPQTPTTTAKAPAPKTQTPAFDNEMDVLRATTLPVMPGAPSFKRAAENVDANSTDKLAQATQSLADSAAKLAGIQPNDGTKSGTPKTEPGMPSVAPVGMSALDAKPLISTVAEAMNPFSPASPSFYKSEPAISQRSTQGSTNAMSAPVAMAPTPEQASRQPFDTVQNVRMAVDQPQQSAAPASGGPAAAAAPGAGGATGTEKPTLDDIPALISDFGLIFINSGIL